MWKLNLFETFVISPRDENGISITVKSKILSEFFNDYKCPQKSVRDYAKNLNFTVFFPETSEWLISDSYVRKSLAYSVIPRFAMNYSDSTFKAGSIPYLGFLSDKNIGEGIKVIFDKPLAKPELMLWYRKIVEYANRLKTEIEAIKERYPLEVVKA